MVAPKQPDEPTIRVVMKRCCFPFNCVEYCCKVRPNRSIAVFVRMVDDCGLVVCCVVDLQWCRRVVDYLSYV